MKEITIDVEILNEQKHAYLKQLFDFPKYYGKNLDALFDCLSTQKELIVKFKNVEKVNDFSTRVISVFNEVSDEEENMHIIFEQDD